MLNFSADVLQLNPELAALRRSGQVRVRPAPRFTDGFDSQLERDFADELRARGHEFRLHGLTLNLPGGVTYTPDFVEWDYAAGVTLYEVKGDLRMKNARDSRTRFKIAAGCYPCFRWVWVTRDRAGQWRERVYVSTGTGR